MAAKAEVPRRLEPKFETLRKLYLWSGNICAFPKCTNRIIDIDGTLIGEVCHIEAAMRDGQRFNEAMTNETRRAFENLMLFCRICHAKTNDVEEYPVPRLQKLKREHEAKFSGIVKLLGQSVVDEVHSLRVEQAKELEAFRKAFAWKWTDEDREESVKEIRIVAKRLKRVPTKMRELLSVIVERSHDDREAMHDRTYALHEEVVAATHESNEAVVGMIKVLAQHGIADGERDEDEWRDIIKLFELESGWNFWSYLRRFCKKHKVPVARVVVGLDFSVLD